MALELQLAHCEKCKGYYSSTVLNPQDLNNPEIIDHYFYHGEPWFTLDKKTFDNSIDSCNSQVKIVDLQQHQENDRHYCSCQNNYVVKTEKNVHQTPKKDLNRKKVKEYIDQDIYFYDLYITYNNFHQDIPARKAI